MGILCSSIELISYKLKEAGIPMKTPVTSRALGLEEALGDPSPYKDFALQRGVEKLMDVEIEGHHGQSFTSSPCNWVGTVGEILSMDIEDDRARALSIGAINSLTSLLGLSSKTVHCKDRGPELCGEEIARWAEENTSSEDIVGVVGYQPAILSNLARTLGPERVRVLDLNPANIGQVRYDVTVWDGDRDLETMADQASICLATGSSLSNGTADSLLETFRSRGKELTFFGTTISGPAALLGLKHICPRSC